VVTSTIAFEGDGRWREYEGGIEDWLAQRERSRSLAAAALSPVVAKVPAAATPASAAAPARKRSYKEQRELDELPARIEALEQEQKVIAERLADPSLYSADAQRPGELQARYQQIEVELLAALERWEALDSRV
jgi:ATP-binding cassette subfamily F protein uup